MVLRRSLLLVVAICALPGDAAAAGLTFTDVQPRSVSWADLGGGSASANGKARLELCNLGPKRVGPIAARPVGFNFAGANVIGDDSVLFVEPDQRSLAPDACTTVRLDARVAPAPGSSTDGAIAATARGGQLARFRLTVAGPSAGAESAQPAPANDSQTFLAKKRTPWSNAHLHGHTDLVVFVPDGAAPLPSEALLGVVMAGSDEAKVYAAGPAKPGAAHVVHMPIRIDGATRGATYSGKLTLTGFDHRSDKDAPNVDVSVVVQDGIGWPIVAILAGLLLTYLAALLMRRLLPPMYLRSDCDDVFTAYDNSAKAFRDRYGKRFPTYSAPDGDERKEFKAEVVDAIKAATTGTWLITLDGDAWKAARKKVDDASTDAAVFGGREDGDLGPTLEGLEKSLEVAEAAFAGQDHVPPFVMAGRALLEGGSLPIGGAATAVTAATGVANLAAAWSALFERAVRARTWIDHFEPEDAATLFVTERLTEVVWLLMQVRDTADLQDLRLDARLDDIERSLLRIATTNGWWRPGDPETRRPAVQAELLDVPATVKKDWMHVGESLGPIFNRLVPRPVRAAVGEASRRLVEVSVLFVALVLGVLAALKLLYFGQSFGTAEDYVSVILLGSAATVATPYLTTAAKQLRAAGSRLPFLS